MNDMKIKIGNTILRNPILGASGCSGWGYELEKYNRIEKIGGFVTKSVTRNIKVGNDTPRLFETRAGMLNSIGLENGGVDYFVDEILPGYEKMDCAIFVNVAPFENTDIKEIIEKIDNFESVDGYEVNISCPNVEKGGISFNADKKSAGNLIRGLRNITKKTLILKLSPYFLESFEIAKEAESEGFDGISFTNTFVGTAVDIEKKSFVFKNKQAGLSGPAIKPLAQWAVYKMVNSVKIPVIGIGGITSLSDILEYLMIGASVVQIGTGVLMNPSFLEDAADGLDKYMKEQKIEKISDIIGIIK